MSRSNWQAERKADYELHETPVSAAYTVRTGTIAQLGLFDNPVNVNVASDFDLKVGSGQFIGQELLIVCSARTSDKTCTIKVALHEAGDDKEFTMDEADEYLYMIWTSTEWATVSASVT